jgi:hypothetical protein
VCPTLKLAWNLYGDELSMRVKKGDFRETLEVVSKPQIRFKGKASRGLEAERTRKYVSISMRGTTQPLEPFELLKSSFN